MLVPAPQDPAIRDRAAGAIMGAFIGDALGLGPHWYYDLAVLRRDYGDWITTYTEPKPGRYHSGLTQRQLSPGGLIPRPRRKRRMRPTRCPRAARQKRRGPWRFTGISNAPPARTRRA